MNKIDKLLKKNLYKDPTLDTQLSTACLQYITERIEFQPAIQPDSYLDQLKYKYRPLNLPNTTKVMEVETSTTSSGGNESTVLPSDSIPKPRQVLYNSDNLQMKWVGSRGVGSGLSNMGNTCFLNSVLQCLTYTPPLYNYLHSDDHKTSCQFQGFCTMCELHRHITRVMNTSGGVVKPIPIVQNLKVFAKHFRYGRQEDAHEFLRYFIDALQRVCLHGYPPKMDQYSKYTTVIHQIFGGYHRSQVKCLECHRTSNTYDPLLDVSLDIKGCSSLIQALQRSIKPDLLDKENKYACPFCKTLTQAQKKFTIHCLPNVLTLQLKRFDYNSVFGGKVNKMINYDECLDLRPYMSEPQGPQEWYRLYAVLVHFGFSCHSGHYFCYVRNSNGIWYSLNDSAVSQVSLSTVLAQEAYLLFYIKDNDYNPPPPSQKKSTLSTNYNKVQSDLGVSVKQTSNVDKTGKPLVHTKPMGVVTPSPKVIPPPPPPPPPSHPPPGPFSLPPPPPSHPPPPPPPPPMKNTTSQFSTDDSFELRKSATPTVKPHATIAAKQPPPPPSVKTTSSVLARPGFTPRSVLKSTKQSLSRPHTPPTKERTLLEIAEEPEQNVSLLNNKPKAYVTPITIKPVARVPPSPQMLGKEVSPLKMEESRMTELPQTDSSDHWNVSDVSATTYGPSLPPQYVQASSPTWSVTALKNNMLPEERNDKIKVVFNKSTKKSHHLHHDDDSEDLDSDEEDVIEKPKDESSKERKQHHRKHHHSNSSVSDEVRGSKKKRHRNISSSEDEEERIRKTSDHKRSDIKHKKYKDYRHHSPHKYENSDSDIEVPKRSRPECPRSRTPERSRKRHHNSSEGRYHRERRSSSLSDERKSHSLKRKKHTHSEPRKRTKSETYSTGDSKKVIKDIKVLKWDESHHHRHHHHHHSHRHHSGTSSSVLDLLDKPNQLGSEVRTWEGERNTIDSSKKEGESKRRGRDEWDREIDKGKVKKTKKHSDIDWERKNKFQDYQNKINAQKHSK